MLHGLYVSGDGIQQQDQKKWLLPQTALRLNQAQMRLLDV
ncbi:hypothetical protein JCM19240_3748 [Vibrio maritimus]|uniref:Uncharacterized protein n=1 Tax=Vibrio maritimus TaxID=990268 RepID=A0A090T819_9VIBR|nr:hypothetical protein JCM19240_3748 [Vibrio maritimus]